MRAAATWIETGSSGSEKGWASAWGRARGCGGVSARRSQATRSALRRLTDTRPRSSASRFQSSSALSISSHGPLASETVIFWMRGLRGKRAGDAAKLDLAAGGGELVLQQVDQEAVVAAALAVVLGQRGDGDEHEHGEEDDESVSKRLPDADVEGDARVARSAG